MRIFMTGGSGYVGSAIARALVGRGHAVDALVRLDASAKKVEALGARPVRGELDAPTWIEAAAACEGLVHAALDSAKGPKGDRAAVDALLTAASREGSRARALVYTSGVWVLGATKAPADEGAPVDSPAPLVAWRPPHERAVLDAASASFVTSVVRPGIVWGGRGGIVGELFESAATEGAARVVGDGANRWPLVHRDDVGEAYARILGERATGVFHAVDGEATRVADSRAPPARPPAVAAPSVTCRSRKRAPRSARTPTRSPSIRSSSRRAPAPSSAGRPAASTRRARGPSGRAHDVALSSRAPMSPLALRVAEHVHGHLGWLAAAALLHPAILLRNPKRRALLAASLAAAFVTLAGALGAALYPAYRERLKQSLFIHAPTIGWLFERKEHLAFGAIALAWVGVVAHASSRRFDDEGTRDRLAVLAHRAFVFAFLLSALTAGLGVAVAVHATFYLAPPEKTRRFRALSESSRVAVQRIAV